MFDNLVGQRKIKLRLDSGLSSAAGSSTKTASFSQDPNVDDHNFKLGSFDSMLVTLDIISADRDDGDETYDFYITSGDGVSKWDICHFPQIVTTGAKRFTARIVSADRLAEITTATPGVSAEPTAIMTTDTGGSNEGIKTLAAGKVRHGPFGDYLGYELVIAGTTPSIVYGITVTGG
jgi:hypothetical protein